MTPYEFWDARWDVWRATFKAEAPHTKIEYIGRTLYIVRPGGAHVNVDKARTRNQLEEKPR